MMKRFLLILLAAALGPLARADWADQFSYRIYSTAEGLCDDYVLSTYKDRTGYLWVSTSDGLDRFDGNRFIHFNSHASDPALRIENDFVYQVAGFLMFIYNAVALFFRLCYIRICAAGIFKVIKHFRPLSCIFVLYFCRFCV